MKPFDIKRFDPQPGITLIEASAGTGKTYSITEIVVDRICRGECQIDELLILTFTNAATAELKERIHAGLKKANDAATAAFDSQLIENVSRAIDHYDRASIQTIHGFCQSILHEFSLECGLSVEFEILKDAKSFETEIRNAVFRKIQTLSETHPILIPFCTWLGFENDFVQKAWSIHGDYIPPVSTTLEDCLQSLEASISQAKDAWLREHSSIQEMFSTSKTTPVLKKKPYTSDDIASAMACFQAWAQSDRYLPDLFDWFKKYSAPSLESVLKKKFTLPNYDFFHACESIFKHTDALMGFILCSIREISLQKLNQLNIDQQQLRYDDLLSRLDQTLQQRPDLTRKLRERYKLGLIDEFQDTDPVQFRILKNIFVEPDPSEMGATPRPLVLIGDPKQAIYSFRGGDIFTYREAKELANETLFLATNWRSTPEINETVNALLRGGSSTPPFAFEWIEYEPVATAKENTEKVLISEVHPGQGLQNNSGLRVRTLTGKRKTSKNEICKLAAREAATILEKRTILIDPRNQFQRQLQPRDIAILVQSNADGAKIRAELSQLGYQATISGGASVFSSREAKDLYQILSAIHNPRRIRHLKGALTTAPFQFTPAKIQALENDQKQWDELLFRITESHQLWEQGHLSQAITDLKIYFKWEQHLSELPDAHRALANHNHLIDLLLNEDQSGVHQPASLLKWFSEKISAPDHRNEEELLRLEQDAQSVHILTTHKSKGLQYPVVLLPFPFESNSNDTKPPFKYHTPTGSIQSIFSENELTPTILEWKKQETFSEKLRLLYVGITRAEYLCVLFQREHPDDWDALDYWIHQVSETDLQPKGLATDDKRGQIFKSVFDCGEPPSETTRQTGWVEPLTPPQKPLKETNWSFSGVINQQSEHNYQGSDELDFFISTPVQEETEREPKTLSIHEFEKGTRAGLFFHSVLETIDFQQPVTWLDLIADTLQAHNYASDPWISIIHQLIGAIADQHLGKETKPFCLKDIPSQALFNEVEFTFPMHFDAHAYAAFKETFENENGFLLPRVEVAEASAKGFMKGVIDLWFEYENHFYLLDWKSNWLGPNSTSYTQSNIVESMNEHHYHLQYLLYLCALKRFLALIRPDFDFDRDFGGVHYIYIRGIRSDSGGDFFTKPTAKTIEALDACFHK